MFNVVVVLFTAVSPNCSGLARSGRPPLCALRGTARQPLSLPPGAPARLLPAARDHRTRAAMSIEKWRALVRQIPKRSLRAIVIRFRAVLLARSDCRTTETSHVASLALLPRDSLRRDTLHAAGDTNFR